MGRRVYQCGGGGMSREPERVHCGDCIYRECIDNGRCLKEGSQWFRSIVKEDNWCGKGVRYLKDEEVYALADSLSKCRRSDCDGCVRQGHGDGDCADILQGDAATMLRMMGWKLGVRWT